MHKYTRATLVIAGLAAVLLGATGFEVSVQPRPQSVVTFANASADVGAVDVYMDHKLIIEDFANTDPTVDIQLTPGDHLVDVFPAGESIVLIKTTELNFEADHRYQLTLDGLEADWSVALAVADETLS